MKLIEFHMNGKRLSIDSERIIGFKEKENGACGIYVDGDKTLCTVDERYDEVMQMVQEANADPTLQDFMVPGFLMEECGKDVE